MDGISLERISGLHPFLRVEARKILAACDEALSGRAVVRFSQVLRTIKEQNDMYALGRTKVNPDGKSKSRPMGYKVTNAKGGDSLHNYGLAVDIVLIIDGKTASWDTLKDFDGDGVSDWMEVVKIFKSFGWAWGGDWSSFVDKPHFEKTFGYTLTQIKTLHSKKSFVPGTTYVALDVLSPINVDPQRKETTTAVNMRTSPEVLNSNVITVLPKGTEVTALSVDGSWTEVLDCKAQKKGWIFSKYLKQ